MGLREEYLELTAAETSSKDRKRIQDNTNKKRKKVNNYLLEKYGKIIEKQDNKYQFVDAEIKEITTPKQITNAKVRKIFEEEENINNLIKAINKSDKDYITKDEFLNLIGWDKFEKFTKNDSLKWLPKLRNLFVEKGIYIRINSRKLYLALDEKVLSNINETKNLTKRGKEAKKKIDITPEKSRLQLFNQDRKTHKKLRDLINKISLDLLNHSQVKNTADGIDNKKGDDKNNPNIIIRSGADILAIVKYYQEGKQGALEGQTDSERTRFYQFGDNKNTVISEKLDEKNTIQEKDKTGNNKVNTNAYVNMTKGGSDYNPSIITKLEKIKNDLNQNKKVGEEYKDTNIAQAMISLMNKGEILEPLKSDLTDKQQQELAEITYLMFGRESVRNKRNLIHSAILLSLAAKGKKPLINVIDDFPMSPENAPSTVRRIDDIDEKLKRYPKKTDFIGQEVAKVEQLETKAINDFIVEEMKSDKIHPNNLPKDFDLDGYTKDKLNKLVEKTYRIKIN